MTDFSYYCDEFGGSVIEDCDDFARLSEHAAYFVQDISGCEPDFDDDDVKCCICALAEVYADMSDCCEDDFDRFDSGFGDDGQDMLLHTAELYLPPFMLCRRL